MRFIPAAIFLLACAFSIAGFRTLAAHRDIKPDELRSQCEADLKAIDSEKKSLRTKDDGACSQPINSSALPEAHALAKASTATSEVRVLTGWYENNLRQIMSWLPEQWELIAVLKWSAYGHDINILGPVAARVAPALGILSNEEALILGPSKPKLILRIGPTTYQSVKEGVTNGLHIQEFVGSLTELNAVTQVAKEQNTVIGISIYLFDHYGDPWGFDYHAPAELQTLVDSIDPRFVKVRGIFTHLGYLSDGPVDAITQRVQQFLRVACPVAARIASSLAADEPPIMIHWGGSSELSRLRDLTSGRLAISSELHDVARDCMAHPKIRFGIRVGSATYGFGELPNLRPVLSWTSPITQLRRTESALIAVVNIGTENGYPRFFLKSGGWGKVSIGGRYYPLAAPPNAHTIEVNIGAAYDPRTIFVGAKVCLLCDDLSADNLSADGVAIDAYNIAMCATGAGTHFAEATSFSYKESLPSCVGPVVLVPEDDDKK